MRDHSPGVEFKAQEISWNFPSSCHFSSCSCSILNKRSITAVLRRNNSQYEWSSLVWTKMSQVSPKVSWLVEIFCARLYGKFPRDFRCLNFDPQTMITWIGYHLGTVNAVIKRLFEEDNCAAKSSRWAENHKKLQVPCLWPTGKRHSYWLWFWNRESRYQALDL